MLSWGRIFGQSRRPQNDEAYSKHNQPLRAGRGESEYYVEEGKVKSFAKAAVLMTSMSLPPQASALESVDPLHIIPILNNVIQKDVQCVINTDNEGVEIQCEVKRLVTGSLLPAVVASGVADMNDIERDPKTNKRYVVVIMKKIPTIRDTQTGNN